MEDVTKSRLWNTKQMAFMLAFVASVTFSASMIWARFLFQEQKTQQLEDLINYVNERVDKKTARIQEALDKAESDIEKLKQPNTDKK